MSMPPNQPGYPNQPLQPGQPGYPPAGQPGQPGYPPAGYPGQPGQPGYPPAGYPGQPGQPGYPPAGQPGQPGYPPAGYPGQPGPPPKKNHSTRNIVIASIATVVAVGLIAVGVWFFMSKGQNDPKPQAAPSSAKPSKPGGKDPAPSKDGKKDAKKDAIKDYDFLTADYYPELAEQPFTPQPQSAADKLSPMDNEYKQVHVVKDVNYLDFTKDGYLDAIVQVSTYDNAQISWQTESMYYWRWDPETQDAVQLDGVPRGQSGEFFESTVTLDGDVTTVTSEVFTQDGVPVDDPADVKTYTFSYAPLPGADCLQRVDKDGPGGGVWRAETIEEGTDDRGLLDPADASRMVLSPENPQKLVPNGKVKKLWVVYGYDGNTGERLLNPYDRDGFVLVGYTTTDTWDLNKVGWDIGSGWINMLVE